MKTLPARAPTERSLLARPTTPVDVVAAKAALLEGARVLVKKAIAPNSAKAYGSDLAHFAAWCASLGYAALPAEPEAVALYVTALASGQADGLGPRKTATIRRRLASIARAHALRELPDPTKDDRVKLVWRGARHDLGVRQVAKTPLLREWTHACVKAMPPCLASTRDAALLLFGHALAGRRSELVALDVASLAFSRGRVVVTLGAMAGPRVGATKTNQEGEWERLVIPREAAAATCPVAALERWLAAAKIASGPVFRGVTRGGELADTRLSAGAVANIVKRRVAAIGLDPALFSGHSLRAGYATSRAMAGDSNREIRKRTRHKSDGMVERYIRDAEFVDPTEADDE